MRGTFFKGIVVGAITSTLVLAASAAMAVTGGTFILGSSNTASTPTALNNSGTGVGLDVLGHGPGAAAVQGRNASSGPGLTGTSAAGVGIFGTHAAATGVAAAIEGQTASTAAGANAIVGRSLSTTPGVGTSGLRGENRGSSSANGSGVAGTHFGGGAGVLGVSTAGPGVWGRTGVPGSFGGRFENTTAGAGSSGRGLIAFGRGHNAVDLGIGPDGFDGGIEAAGPNGIEGNSHTPGGFGVSGDAPTVGVNGTATSAGGTGVRGTGGGAGTGVNASGGTTGVSAAGGTTGITATGDSVGVESTVTASGAVGITSTAGSSANDAVQGNTASASGDALQGITTGGNAFGLFAITSAGSGIVSSSASGTGVAASNSSATNPTVASFNSAAGGTAGTFTATNALRVRPNAVIGTTGLTADMTGDANGDGNVNNDAANAIVASSDDTNNSAVITSNSLPSPTCDALTCEAIETQGFVDVNGNARVTGTLTKGAGSFEIDHPQDPSHYYLRHSFVESPDMKNVYDGVVTTGKKGKATIELPTYFGALNRTFRYQLTVIGGSFAQAIVSKEIAPGGHSFKIRTNKPHVKVSWQVTGIRKDAYANAHRIRVVERKTGDAANMFLHPELFGHPHARPLGLDVPNAAKFRTAAADRAQARLNALIEAKASAARHDARHARHTAPPAVPVQHR